MSSHYFELDSSHDTLDLQLRYRPLYHFKMDNDRNSTIIQPPARTTSINVEPSAPPPFNPTHDNNGNTPGCLPSTECGNDLELCGCSCSYHVCAWIVIIWILLGVASLLLGLFVNKDENTEIILPYPYGRK